MPNTTPYREIPLDQLTPTAHNPRGVRIRGARLNIQDLVPSVREHGIIEPLVVRQNGNGYEILAGERRWRAAKKAGLPAVPCVVRDADDRSSRAVTLIENLHRQDLHPLQEAEGIARLLDEEGFTMASVAAELGLSLSTVARRAQLRELLPKIRKLFVADESPIAGWTIRHLELCASYPRSTQGAVAERIEINSCYTPDTVAELRRWLERGALSLDSAPWSVGDAELLPEAGPCSACPLRSGCEPLLFEDLQRDEETPRCLNAECYEKKRTAWLSARVREAQEEHGEALALVSKRYSGPSDHLPAFGSAVRPVAGFKVHEEPARGRIPALVVEDSSGVAGEAVGKVVWLVPEKGRRAEQARRTAGQDDQSLEARAARAETLLRRKRLRHAVPALLELAEATMPARAKLLRLVTLFGGPPRHEERAEFYPESIPKPLRARSETGQSKQPAPLWAAFEAPPDDAEIAAKLWADVRGVLARRLETRYAFNDFDSVEAEAQAYACLIGASWADLWAAARKACPPSKALAKRRAALQLGTVTA